MKNIQWKVTQINYDKCYAGDAPDITAELKAYFTLPPSPTDIMNVQEYLQRAINSNYGVNPSTKLPKIKKVIFNDPATIIIWSDETKTVVKAAGEEYDPEKGLAMAITKKALGNEGNYYDTIKKCLKEGEKKIREKTAKKEHSAKWLAYQRLQNALGDKKATKADLLVAMEEACGYLGESLDT